LYGTARRVPQVLQGGSAALCQDGGAEQVYDQANPRSLRPQPDEGAAQGLPGLRRERQHQGQLHQGDEGLLPRLPRERHRVHLQA